MDLKKVNIYIEFCKLLFCKLKNMIILVLNNRISCFASISYCKLYLEVTRFSNAFNMDKWGIYSLATHDAVIDFEISLNL